MFHVHILLAALALATTSGYSNVCDGCKEDTDDMAMMMHAGHRELHTASCALTGEDRTEVRMFRHCVRSTTTKVEGANPNYTDTSDYTSLPLPNWNTPEKWCTGQGAELIESTGKQIKERRPSLHASSVKVLVDTNQRDATTANSLLLGLAGKDNVYTSKVEYFPVLFDAYDPDGGKSLCSPPNGKLDATQKQRQLAATPMPMGVGLVSQMDQRRYTQVLQLMEGFIGIGIAGPLKDLTNPPVIEEITKENGDVDGVLTGAPIVLKEFAQNMLYSYASGISYTTAQRAQIYELSSWIYWYRKVDQTPAHLVPKKACGMLSIIDNLLHTLEQDVFYVGHDSDLDALAYFFNVTWEAPPFPGARPTPPGSSLVFATDGTGKALVHFAYQDFDSKADSTLKVVQASPCKVDLLKVKAWAESNIVEYAGSSCLEACKGLLPHRTTSTTQQTTSKTPETTTQPTTSKTSDTTSQPTTSKAVATTTKLMTSKAVVTTTHTPKSTTSSHHNGPCAAWCWYEPREDWKFIPECLGCH